MKTIIFSLTMLIFLSGCEKKYDSIIDSQNVPPIISNIWAPDSLTVLPTDTVAVLLTIDVYDADGLKNIQSVYFNSYRPDGTPSSGNPFYMYDDGKSSVSGDQTKDDGTFSRVIILPPGTSLGKRRFEFQAIDLTGERSNIINHYILIK